jgi:hypothetical protein
MYPSLEQTRLYPLAFPSTFFSNEHKPSLFDHWRFCPAAITFADHRLTDPEPDTFVTIQADDPEPDAARRALVNLGRVHGTSPIAFRIRFDA